MFIRTKKIKGNEYAYLSENRWSKRDKKVRQKTKKYLGRVYRFDKINDIDFNEFCSDIKSCGIGDLIRNVICCELKKHGFEFLNRRWQRKGCFVDLRSNRIYGKRGSSIAIGLNEGFLSDYTLRRLFCYARIKDGYDYAKKFVEAGLDIPKDVFVELYRKIFKGFDGDDLE